jgi:two-component system, LytTR family, response regulator
MKALIIEDEKKTRESLEHLLKKYCPEIKTCISTDNFHTGYELIKSEKPSLLFIDIQLNSEEGTGLDLINTLQLTDCAVIFISGHRDYAVEAFRLKAVDYLLKPIRIDQLIEAVKKGIVFLDQKNNSPALKDNKSDTFHIPTQNGFVIIHTQDIIRCEADGAYTHFHVKGKKEKITSSVNIGQIEQKLNNNFFRVHKSHIINKAFVEGYSKAEGLIVKMSDQFMVPVSRTLKEQFFNWLN